MKVFCPTCEKETECNLPIEVYTCTECNEDFADYDNPLITKLESEVERLQIADMTTRISELEEASRWIPVSERLPEVVELVLCYAPHFHSVEIRWSDKIGEAVKYWRPMPDAPQEGEG